MNLELEHFEYAKYYYTVREFVTTFGLDAGNTEPFSHESVFDDDDLLVARKKAKAYYHQQLSGIDDGKYILPFESPENFKFGANAAVSISLYLVEYFNDDNINMYSFTEPDELKESIESEKSILEVQRYDISDL